MDIVQQLDLKANLAAHVLQHAKCATHIVAWVKVCSVEGTFRPGEMRGLSTIAAHLYPYKAISLVEEAAHAL